MIIPKQGVISCSPKGDKPRHFLKEIGDQSLLNAIYKIASVSNACRIKNKLQIINIDQIGFVSGQFIGDITC